MTEAIGPGTYFFPYQFAVLIAILTEDVVDAPELIRAVGGFSVVTVLVSLPTQILLLTVLLTVGITMAFPSCGRSPVVTTRSLVAPLSHSWRCRSTVLTSGRVAEILPRSG